MLLEISNINVYYDNIHAIKDVSFGVKRGQIVSLVGANGAGKSTILKTVSGLLRSKTGNITFKGNSIKNLSPEQIVKHKISHVPEGRKIFSSMTVKENLEIGSYTKPKNMHYNMESVFKRFPRLKERQKQLAGTLSGGEQQMLAIGRALMSEPEFLMLDEPSMGLAPILIAQVFEIIKELNKSGMTILVVEQNASTALSISNIGHVLEVGKIVVSNEAKLLLNDEVIKRAYLGG